MKITWMKLSNYRCFSDFEIDFHPNLTVIVAKNGQGKTAILDAVSTALGPYLGAFSHGVGRSIAVSDARYHRTENSLENEQVYPVVIQGGFTDPEITITRELNSSKSRTTSKDARALSDFAVGLNQQLMDLENVNLPVVASYGCGRLWNAHKNMDRKAVLSASRGMGYEDATTPASSYTQVQQWITKATFASFQQEQMDIYEGYKIADQIRGIQAAVDCVLEDAGWSKIHYSFSHEELAMNHKDFGILPVSLLSDGVRAMVSMVADLAWRCSKLNPHLGERAPIETKGIAIIDEVDMHLHPSWQQKVISALQKAFPKVQLIVTTHSPQVLTTVKKESIRTLVTSDEGRALAQEPLLSSYGMESQDTLFGIMGVDPQPPVSEKSALNQLTTLIESGQYGNPESQRLLADLTNKLGPNHSQIERLQRSIRRMEALKR